MYRLVIATPDLRVISDTTGRMPEVRSRISEAFPEFLQTGQTILNAIALTGFYVRGAIDTFGLPSLAIVTPLPN